MPPFNFASLAATNEKNWCFSAIHLHICIYFYSLPFCGSAVQTVNFDLRAGAASVFHIMINVCNDVTCASEYCQWPSGALSYDYYF